MSSRCVWCNIPYNYYSSHEHASRQSCRESDSGYHEFSYFPCLSRLISKKLGRRRNENFESLLVHRREKRPNTI